MSAIPSLTREDVLKAVQQIDRDGVPPRRNATKFALVVNGRRYPPKYVVSLAAQFAVGRELRPDEFSGGPETNERLRELGFSIDGPGMTSRGRAPSKPAPKRRAPKKPLRKPRRQKSPPRKPAATKVDAVQPARTQRTALPKQVVIVRAVVVGPSPGTPARGERALLEVLRKKWPAGMTAKFLLTPGGFICGDLPDSWTGRKSWASRPSDVRSLIPVAQDLVEEAVTDDVLDAAAGRVEVITVGVDLWNDRTTEAIELVAVVDVATGDIVAWTGKSYPVPSQEKTLIQVSDLRSHFVEAAGERVLVLGCHDLSMWNPRGWANQRPGSTRRKRCAAMRKMTKDFNPTVVLQHPHTTDTPRIWAQAWGEIRRQFPDLKAWGSGNGGYDVRGGLDSVLSGTQGGSVHDITI